MLQPATFTFLSRLKKNNNKPWFDKNKQQYLDAKTDVENFLSALAPRLEKFDPAIRGIDVRKCVFRIYRDIRFSNDKTPYKTHLGAFISPQGKSSNGPGYYMHIQPGNSFLAGGVWMPEGDMLYKIRQEIDYNLGELKKILNNSSFKKYFGRLSEEAGKLKIPPKGYPKDHPAIEILKLKSFIVSHKLSDKQLQTRNAVSHCTAVFKELHRLNRFLARALD